MTDASPTENGDGPSVLHHPDHDRGIDEITVTITGVIRPTPRLIRFTACLPVGADNPSWAQPNVAVRLQLGADFGHVSRVYTVRTYDPATRSFDVDVVVHGDTSPMMRWTSGLRPGDTVLLAGPRPQLVVPEAPERRVALFLDATAIPALYSMLEQWPTGLEGVGWVATSDRAAFDELPGVTGVDLRRVDPDAELRPLATEAISLDHPEQYVVWGAGERDEMRDIRRHFRDTVGLTKDEVAVFGYWKRGVTNTEIDRRRLQSYQRLLADGGSLEELDDLAIEI